LIAPAKFKDEIKLAIIKEMLESRFIKRVSQPTKQSFKKTSFLFITRFCFVLLLARKGGVEIEDSSRCLFIRNILPVGSFS
jgi:hypothetical protein